MDSFVDKVVQIALEIIIVSGVSFVTFCFLCTIYEIAKEMIIN